MAKAFARAVEAHNRARASLDAAVRGLAGRDAAEADTQERHVGQLRELADGLARIGAELVPGWCGEVALTGAAVRLPALGRQPPADGPMLLRIGTAHPTRQASFPVVVSLLGAGHLVVDADIREPRVVGLLRSVLVRLLAALPPESVTFRLVDAASAGVMFAGFQPLVDAGAMPPPAIDGAGFAAVLDEAEAFVRTGGRGFFVVLGALPGDVRGQHARLAALAHAGPAAGLCLVVAGWPPNEQFAEHRLPPLAHAASVSLTTQWAKVHDPPGVPVFAAAGRAFPAVVALDPDPDAALVGWLSGELAAAQRQAAALSFNDLLPADLWGSSSVDGMATPVGRAGRDWCAVRFDDATPQALLGGRSGSGKTNSALDLLGGLTARYAPGELALYLLDFKEGVSFTEFTPTADDPTWVPHARAVGVESDREYGVAVLAELVDEMNRRADAMKSAGVTKLADLRRARPDVPLPRILAVIDEFQVLFAGNDPLAGRATTLLEEIARKGRAYGVHLLLASQTMSGIEALYTKTEAIFGQFPLRIALAGGSGVLDHLNDAADALPVGTAVVNTQAGVASANTIVRLPHADAASVAALRHRLWEHRPRGNPPPSVFVGYAEQHIIDDPRYRRLSPTTDAGGADVLVGRCVDVGLSTAMIRLEPVPGRHLAVLGTSTVGADILHAAALALARQHRPGTARFVLACLATGAREACEAARQTLTDAGHAVETATAATLPAILADLADAPAPVPEPRGDDSAGRGIRGFGFTFDKDFTVEVDPTDPALTRPTGHAGGHVVPEGMAVAGPTGVVRPEPSTTARDGGWLATYLLAFGAEAAGAATEGLRRVLRTGPGQGVHVLGWWRTVSGLEQTIGYDGREDVACLVALNIAASDLGKLIGDYTVTWQPRPNRALLIDRHANSRQLIVPFVRARTADRYDQPPWKDL